VRASASAIAFADHVAHASRYHVARIDEHRAAPHRARFPIRIDADAPRRARATFDGD
jgi:hypothetical protein